jgi:inorganic pyrophosphatase
VVAPDEQTVKVIVEIPKGSRNKYERNPETGEIEFDRRLFAAVSYPTEYGFIPETQAGDGDELDALVAVTEPTFPGCVIRMRPIALLRVFKGEEPNPKVLGVPLTDPAWNDLNGRDDLPGNLADEVEHFFNVYNELGGSDFRTEGWGTREEAEELIEECRRRFRESDA